MNDNTLYKISLITFVIGIVILFFLLENAALPERQINNISEQDIDKMVTVKGQVVAVRQRGNITTFNIAQQCTITAVVFENISVAEGQEVSVQGKLEEYMGKKELLVERLET